MQFCVLIGCICALCTLVAQSNRRTMVNETAEADSPAWTADITKLDLAVDRFYQDVRVMDQVKYTFEKTSMTRVAEGATKKIAYLFMVKDGVDQHQLWWKFFSDADPSTISIYFHQYARDSDTAAKARDSWSQLGTHFIPKVRTGWGQLSGVEYALLWEALRDPANAQFVLLSEGHVPLKSASYVYRYLMRESDNSKICFNQPIKRLHLAGQEVKRTCTYRDSLQDQELPATITGKAMEVKGRVRKHHQWLILARRHAVDVIENGQDAMRRHLSAAYRAPLPNGDAAMLGASDEGFIATALLLASERADTATVNSEEELYVNGIRSECTSFVYWRHCFSGTALGAGSGWKNTKFKEARKLYQAAKQVKVTEWFDARKSPAKSLNDTPRDFGKTDSLPTEKYMKDLVKAGFLFARKFGKDEKGRLSRDYYHLLPPLWAEFENNMAPITDEKLANESRAWPVLDVGDPVVKESAKSRIGK